MADDYRGLFEAAIARLQPGNAMEQYEAEGIKSRALTSYGTAMQATIGSRLSGSSLAPNLALQSQKEQNRAMLGVTAAREAQLGNAQMQLGGLLFQGSEREKAQKFTAGESALNRAFTAAESTKSQQFTALESEKTRAFTTLENALSREFTGSQAEKTRAFTEAQNALSREFEAKQKALEREFTSAESRKSEEYKTKETELLRKFTAEQNDLNRAAEMAGLRSAQAAQAGQASSLQQFTAKQNELNRAATAEQGAAQRATMYPALDYSPGGAVPDVFGGGVQSFGGGTTTGGGWSSYIGSTGGSLGTPATGQSWVNGQYIPSTEYPTPASSVAQPTLIGQAIQKLIDAGATTPKPTVGTQASYYGGWEG